VVRSELVVRPELVVQVAQDAVNAVLMSARTITVHVNPEDHALISLGAADVLEARDARLVSQPGVERGGCLIESDAGTVDARIGARWHQAVQALGTGVDWTLEDGPEGDGPG
jgi:flagellar assembly protein FliH